MARVVVDPVTRIEGHLRIEAVVENGMITDEGTHERLMTHTGTYRRLYDLQFVDVEISNGSE